MLRIAGLILGVAAGVVVSSCGSSQQASSPPAPVENRASDAGAIAAPPADAGTDAAQAMLFGSFASLEAGDGGVVNMLGNATLDGGVYGLGGLGTSGAWGSIGSGAGGKVVVGVPASQQGALTKDEIQRIVRRQLPRIRYCYEKRLLKQPDLEGRIKVSFTIGKDGAIIAARIAEGMHAEVDGCVEEAVKAMRFPKPRGGGNVVVNYPFVFETAADEPADAGPPAP